MSVLEAQYRQKDFLVRELYVTTVASACGAILVGVALACLALHNVAADPQEAACRYPGSFREELDFSLDFYKTKFTLIYIRTGLVTLSVVAFAFSLTSVVSWLAQFFLRLRQNALVREDVLSGGWSSEGGASLGVSFW